VCSELHSFGTTDNRIRNFLNMEPLKYDTLQIGLGWVLVNDYLVQKRKFP
jgi:hypothetical protein